MISYVLSVLLKGVLYVRNHPQIFFVLILLIAFPLLFLYTGQQFLEVGRANQETLQLQRVGLMHDVFASLMAATKFEPQTLQTELTELAGLNPDIIGFRVLQNQNGAIIPISSLNEAAIGIPEENTDLYRNISIKLDESIIFEEFVNGERIWNAYRAVQTVDGGLYFLHTEMSLRAIDDLFASREQSAYFSLIFVYCFIVALAFWHIRLTDYRYLYIAAQKASETKDLFTNMMAHELRAPLTAIRGYSSMLAEQLTDTEQQKYAARVKESSERLIAIVNDLLDVARIQSGKLSVVHEDVDLVAVLKVVLDELRVSAREKSIVLLQSGVYTESIIQADKKRLHQAFTNLVSNSIKYTPKGTIEITVEEKVAYYEVRVKDTGMGISSDDQKKLFAPFFRVESDKVDKITGSGLGMWITKELIELMHGSIAIESIKGVGTHVVVKLMKKTY
jgi:signal transduction histidine kinase